MTHEEFLLGLPVALAVAYPLTMRMFAEAAQPTRLVMADIERHLLSSEALSPRHKAVVKAGMDSAMDTWALPGFAAAIPRIMFSRCLRRERLQMERPKGADGHLFERFMRLTLVSACAANPIFAFVVICEAVVFASIEICVEFLHKTRAVATDGPLAVGVFLKAGRPKPQRKSFGETLTALTDLAISIQLVIYSH